MLLLLKSFVCLQTCYVADLHLHISSNIPHRDLKQRNKKQRISHLEVVHSKNLLSGGNFFATSRQQFACFGVETKHSIDSFYLKTNLSFRNLYYYPKIFLVVLYCYWKWYVKIKIIANDVKCRSTYLVVDNKNISTILFFRMLKLKLYWQKLRASQ